MKRVFSLLFCGLAVWGALGTFVARADDGFSAWFSEDAETFSSNADGRWIYTPGSASAAYGRIVLNWQSVMSTLTYDAPKLAEDVRSTIIEHQSVCFVGLGSSTRAMGEDDLIGVQLVERPADNTIVFALYEPSKGLSAWRVCEQTATPSARYDLRIELRFSTGTKTATYAFRPSGSADTAYTILGTVILPATAELPTEIAFSGEGNFAGVESQSSTEEGVNYQLWAAAPGLLTWSGSGSFESGKFTIFDRATAEETAVSFVGNQPSTQVPGYEGTTLSTPWDIFSGATGGHYLAPGHALRLAGAGQSVSATPSILHFGGLLVEAGATGWTLAGASASETTKLGDATGTAPTWFVVNEDFALARGGDMPVLGEVTLKVAEGKTLTLTRDDGQTTLTLASGTKLCLAGAGTVRVGTLLATGTTTLDLTGVSTPRTTAFIDGNLTVDASTQLAFPAAFVAGASFPLCTGTLAGLSSGLRTVLIDGVETSIYLDVDGNIVTRNETTARARISSDIAWSAANFPWETGAAWHPGLPVELTFVNAAAVSFDTTLSDAKTLTVKGPAAGTLDFGSTAPAFTALSVATGADVTLRGTSATWGNPLTLNGTLRIAGTVTLASTVSSTGSIVVPSGATLAFASGFQPASKTLLDVSGSVQALGGITFGAENTLTLRAGARLTSTGAGSFALSSARLTVPEGTATIDATVKGLVKSGAGTLAFGSAFASDTKLLTIQEGSLCLTKNLVVSAPVEMASGTTLKAVAGGATISGAFTQGGLLFVDCSALTSDSETVLTVASTTSLTVGNIQEQRGDWTFTLNGSSLIATRKGASEKTKWDTAVGVLTWKTVDDSSFAEGLFSIYTPSTKAESADLPGSDDSLLVPGYLGVTTKPYAVFSQAATDGRYRAPGYVLRLADNDVLARTLVTEFADLHVGGLFVESGATGYVIRAENDGGSAGRATILGDTRTVGVTNYLDLAETLTITRPGAITLAGALNVQIAADKYLRLNDTRTSAAYQPKFASNAVLVVQGAGSIAVPTLSATGGVTLDFTGLDATHAETPYFVGVPNPVSGYRSGTGNLVIDAQTQFRFPSWLAENTAFALCYGTLTGGVNGLRTISVGGVTSPAILTFEGNTVSYSLQVNTATLGAGSQKWSEITWTKGAWIPGAPVVLTLTGDTVLVLRGEGVSEVLSSVTLSGPYQVAFVREVGSVESVILENGATLAQPEFVWTGAGDGLTWEDQANWSYSLTYPFVGSRVRFNSSATVTAGVPVAGELHLDAGTQLTLTMTVDGCFDGVFGGTLVKKGSATVQLATVAETGRALSATTLRAQEGVLALGKAEETASVFDTTLIAEGGEIVAVGAAFTLDGVLTLSAETDGAVLTNSPAACVWTASSSSGALLKTGAGKMIFGAALGSSDQPFVGSITVEEGILSFAEARADSVISGSVSGTGKLGVEEETTLSLRGTLALTGGFVGEGMIGLTDLPPTLLATSLTEETWLGTLWLDGLTLASFYPNRYGNERSSIRLSACSGTLASGTFDILPAFALTGSSALHLTGAQPNTTQTLINLTGSGELWIDCARAGEGYGLEIVNVAGFSGSYRIEDGDILVGSGAVATLGSNATWKASEGVIDIRAAAIVTNHGTLASQVVGAGEVDYQGAIPTSKIESYAKFSYTDWTGTVRIAEATLANGAHLDQAGNRNSKIVLANVQAETLGGQDVDSNVELLGAGLTLTNSPSALRIRELSGDGAFTFENASGEAFVRVDAVTNFTGSLTVKAGSASVGLGALATNISSKTGALIFGEGVSVRTDRPEANEWTAQNVAFGDVLKVIGRAGSVLLTATNAKESDVAAVDVKPSLVSDSRISYGLIFNSLTKKISVSQSATPPSMDIAEVAIVYGADLTNASVRVSVTNYWKGIDYTGSTYLRVWIYKQGEPYTVVGTTISGDGVYDFGTIPLVRAVGQNYTYRVEIESGASPYAERETVASTTIHRTGSLPTTTWIYETAETFPAGAAKKTGTWAWEGPGEMDDHLFVDPSIGRICIRYGDETAGCARFTANKKSEGLVTCDLYFDAEGKTDVVSEQEPLTQGGFILSVNEDAGSTYQVLDPELNQYVDVVQADRSSQTADPALHHLHVQLNYLDGTISYRLDDYLLTNETHADGFFQLSSVALAQAGLSGVQLTGTASIDLLEGANAGTNLAQTVVGTTTNFYGTVDDAVQAVTDLPSGTDATLTLLWDATWSPRTNSVGKTFNFDFNGHRLILDAGTTNRLARAGYCVIDNGKGSYTVGVYEYALSFWADEKDPESPVMPPMPFSATNLVFNLASNVFVREGFDFANWLDEEGRTYADGARIDMSVYGLTNVVLSAQWKPKVRLITIEPTAEYVYLEYVKTNGVMHTGLKYIPHEDPIEEAKGRGTVLIPIMNGSDMVVKFTTDIEKMLDFTTLETLYPVASDGTLTNRMPKVISDISEVLTEIQYWAVKRGISLESLAKSLYAKSSYTLNTRALLTTDSQIVITDFETTEEGCSFCVMVDGEPLDDTAKLNGFVKTTDNLLSGKWTDATGLTVDANGRVNVPTTSNGTFVKIVIPQD